MRTLFYRLPRLTVLAILIMVAGGLGAMLTLGRQEDPTLIERYGNIVTLLPGADAMRMEALITDPIETALLELPELAEVASVTRANVSVVGFDMSDSLSASEVEDAWTLVRAQADSVKPSLPEGATDPNVQRFFIGATTILVSLTWEGAEEPELAVMARMAQDVEDLLGNLPGTEETEIFGLPREEIRVEVDGDALSAAGLTMRQAAGLIRAADAKVPAGQIRTGSTNVGLEVGGAFESISRIREVPLLQRPDGSALRVGDIADVSKGTVDPQPVLNFNNDKRAVLVGAYISTGLRVDQWAVTAREKIAAFQAEAPGDIAVDILFDQSEYTNERLGDLAQNLGYSALIVLVVLFLLMGWRAAIIVGTALPLTVCLVLILFNFFGYPLHQMSVTGLVISLGLLIDNAIVVVDEYDQKRNKGESRLDAMDKSLGHLFGPLFASTLTTALAFAPIAMLPGGAGEFVGMIGVSVIFAVVSSFLISMTVIPALAGWFDMKREGKKRRWWRDGLNFEILSDGYRWTVERVLRFPLFGIALGVVPAFIGFYLVGQLPSQFFPQTERNQFQMQVSLGPEASINETVKITERATELLLANPKVTDVNWTLGESAPRVYYNSFNRTEGVEGYAGGWVTLTDSKATREVIGDIQTQVRLEFPEAEFLALPFEQGPPQDAPISFFFRGDNLETLNALGEEARRILSTTPGITYTTSSLRLGSPTITLRADETTSAMAGNRLAEVAGDLSAELEGVIAGSVLEGVEEIPVRVVAPNETRSRLSSLGSTTIGARPGSLGTPISALGEMTLDPQTATITRDLGRRTNIVRGFLDPYHLAAPTLAKFQTRLDESGFELPAGYEMVIGGEAGNSADATTNLLTLAIPLIIIMTGAVTLVFNSFRLALLILIGGFLSMGLAFMGVWMFNLPFGFNAILGSLGLLGISINGSIVVLSMLNGNEACQNDDVIAQRETVVDATRHIIATTLTTMGSFIPILLQGDMFWMPFAAAIAGGVAGSALLALYFTPSVYRIMTMRPISRFFGWIFGAKKTTSPMAAE